MGDLWVAAVLGIVEGITEFLPVSSTGHLIVAGDLLHFSGETAASFEIFIQLGAILAVVVLYWPRFIGLIPTGEAMHEYPQPNPLSQGEGASGPGCLGDAKPIWNQCTGAGCRTDSTHFSGIRGLTLLFLTTLPALALGAVAHGAIKHYLFSPVSVALALAVGALGILLAEKFRPTASVTNLDALGYKQAFLIGLFQCIAMWPGMSRSASTIIGGLFSGLDRKVATEYSFLAAVPVMIAATSYDLYKAWRVLQATDLSFFAVGFVVSFVFAALAVKTFIAAVQRWSLAPYAWYRLAIAPIIFFTMS